MVKATDSTSTVAAGIIIKIIKDPDDNFSENYSALVAHFHTSVILRTSTAAARVIVKSITYPDETPKY